MFLYILRELLKLAESRFGWALFAGTQNNHKPIVGYFGRGSTLQAEATFFAVWAGVRKVASADNRSNPSRNLDE